jgi:hypothetical protein
MHGYEAERLVPATPAAVRTAIADLIVSRWGDRSRVVLDEPAERIDAIATAAEADDADVWLSWQLAVEAGGTRVRIRLDELETGPDPGGALVELLEAVTVSAIDEWSTPPSA